jgi:hypothetical protein
MPRYGCVHAVLEIKRIYFYIYIYIYIYIETTFSNFVKIILFGNIYAIAYREYSTI